MAASVAGPTCWSRSGGGLAEAGRVGRRTIATERIQRGDAEWRSMTESNRRAPSPCPLPPSTGGEGMEGRAGVSMLWRWGIASAEADPTKLTQDSQHRDL